VLKSSPEIGLDLIKHPNQMLKRKLIFGENSVASKKLTTFLEFCWEAVQDFVLIMLIVLGVIEIILTTVIVHDNPYGWIEGVAILFAVCIVVLVTATIDHQKQKSFVQLSKTLDDTNTKTLIRNGQVMSVVDADIVVGDILSVNSHNSANIPADCVLLGPSTGSGLKMDEASMTGESKLVTKKPGDVVLSGTVAVQGSGKMVVIAVGPYSVAGKIKARVYEADNKEGDLEGDTETPLFSKLTELAKQIAYAGTAAALLTFFASLILGLVIGKAPPTMILKYFIVSVTVLAVAVPEGLPLAVTLALAFSSQRMTKDQNLVKHLDACETMGCATTICTDKTGECYLFQIVSTLLILQQTHDASYNL
jgi:Ca2+ transporting ATPase